MTAIRTNSVDAPWRCIRLKICEAAQSACFRGDERVGDQKATANGEHELEGDRVVGFFPGDDLENEHQTDADNDYQRGVDLGDTAGHPQNDHEQEYRAGYPLVLCHRAALKKLFADEFLTAG
jgi:hypothetical protein